MEVYFSSFPYSIPRTILLWLLWKNITDWVSWTTEIYFCSVLEACSSKSRCQQVWFLSRPLSLACRRLSANGGPSIYVVSMSKSHLMAPLIFHYGPSTWLRLTLITCLKALSPNTVIFWDMGVRASTYELCECTTQFIIPL